MEMRWRMSLRELYVPGRRRVTRHRDGKGWVMFSAAGDPGGKGVEETVVREQTREELELFERMCSTSSKGIRPRHYEKWQRSWSRGVVPSQLRGWRWAGRQTGPEAGCLLVKPGLCTVTGSLGLGLVFSKG